MRLLLCFALLVTPTLAADLPDPFVFADGHRVKTVDDWTARRKELAELIQEHEYGHLPPAPKSTTGALLVAHKYRPLAATHRVYKITCDLGDGRDKLTFIVDLLFPPGDGPFPVIVRGDLGWGKTPDLIARQILDRGYILADFDRCEFAPDKGTDAIGLYAAYPKRDFGAIAGWAWGYSRCVDFLLILPEVDKEKIVITGHSRGGKSVLLAGALDVRIALTAPNCSGCGGAGSFRVQGPDSEKLGNITQSFPFWFSPRLKEYVGREDQLPFDQHALKALVAPRALLTTEALQDLHANPSGTWITHLAAREVYAFLENSDRIGIMFRPGVHEHNVEDFTTLLDFADRVFFNKPSKRDWNSNPYPDPPKAFSWSAPQR